MCNVLFKKCCESLLGIKTSTRHLHVSFVLSQLEIKMHMIYLHSFQYKNDRKYEYNTLKKKLKHLTDVHV